MNLNIMRDKPFINKEDLQEIRSHKRVISAKAWEKIDRHFDETEKTASKIYSIRDYLKVAAGIMVLLSFTWLFLNRNLEVYQEGIIVLENKREFNPFFQYSHEYDHSEQVARMSETGEEGSFENPVREEGEVLNVVSTTPPVNSDIPNLGQEKKEKNTLTTILPAIVEANLVRSENLAGEDSRYMAGKREFWALSSIETKSPTVYSRSLRELDLRKYIKETEIPDSYFEGTSAGAMVGQSLFSLISENEVLSELNSKFQKIKNLEVIQINW